MAHAPCALQLYGLQASAAALFPYQHLQHLEALELRTPYLEDEGAEDGLQSLLQQAPGLTQLQWSSWGQDGDLPLPRCLEDFGGLRRLCLERQGLTDLPPCAWLPGKSCLGAQACRPCCGSCGSMRAVCANG